MEDVKLMAEFMGIKWPMTKPNYPKDMNELLGVIKKLRENHGVFWSCLPYYENGHPISYQVTVGKSGKFLVPENVQFARDEDDLPTVLFPLLVEAIKQTKESE